MIRKSLDVFVNEVEGQQDFTREGTAEWLAGCDLCVHIMEGLWKLAQGLLERGMESKKLMVLLKEIVGVFEFGIKAFGIAGEKMKAANLTPEECTEAIARLELAARLAAERHAELSALLQWLETPPKEVALSELPASSGSQQAQGYVSLDVLTTRLLAGIDR